MAVIVRPSPSSYLLEFSGAADAFIITDDDITAKDVWVTNVSGNDRFLQLFDADSLPSNGAVPLYSVRVVSGLTAGHEFISTGAYFQEGLVAALSSTGPTLTVTVASEGLFGALVRAQPEHGDV